MKHAIYSQQTAPGEVTVACHTCGESAVFPYAGDWAKLVDGMQAWAASHHAMWRALAL